MEQTHSSTYEVTSVEKQEDVSQRTGIRDVIVVTFRNVHDRYSREVMRLEFDADDPRIPQLGETIDARFHFSRREI